MTLDEWVVSAPEAIRTDFLWRIRAYQIGTYLGALAPGDAAMVARDIRVSLNCGQLARSIGGVTANIADGYSRRSRKDRIRFYEYALSEANEAKSWYLSAMCALGRPTVEHRLQHLARVTQLLLATIQNERKGLTWGTDRRIPLPPREDPRPGQSDDALS